MKMVLHSNFFLEYVQIPWITIFYDISLDNEIKDSLLYLCTYWFEDFYSMNF